MLKSRLLAYDGRGNCPVPSAAAIPSAWSTLRGFSGGEGALFVEAWVPVVRELAVVVARSTTGECVAYAAVHTLQKDSICHVLLAPAQGVAPAVLARTQR